MGEYFKKAWGDYVKWREKNYKASGMGDKAIPGTDITYEDLMGYTGLMGGLKLFRGIPGWLRKGMVRGGRHVGPKQIRATEGWKDKPSYIQDYLHTSPHKNYSKIFAEHHVYDQPPGFIRGPKILEYDVPLSKINKYAHGPFKSATDILKQKEVVFPKGLPKKYLKKIHKLPNTKQEDFREVFAFKNRIKADLIKRQAKLLKK